MLHTQAPHHPRQAAVKGTLAQFHLHFLQAVELDTRKFGADLLRLSWYVRLVRGPFLQMASWFSA